LDRLRILWSYIDSRDLAIACRLGIERDGFGCEPLNIVADDTSSNLHSRELARPFLPNVVDFRAELNGRASLISNRRAKELLGFKQQFFLL